MDRLGENVLNVEPARARAAIATAVLSGNGIVVGETLGSIALHPHQVDAVHRLRNAIDEFGGAILCDPVGTGKTFTALALIPEGGVALVVAPAVLRSMWTNASEQADRAIAFVSFEALSRGAYDQIDARLLIVDEAHHARNPATRRFGSLSRLALGKNVLLMSATPIHNRRKDLTALLSLFLGSRAERLSIAEFGRCVLRRDQAGLASAITPRVERLRWLALPESEALLNMILALPPPLPPSDGGDGGALVGHLLIRQWASSDGALSSGIVKRLQKAVALIAALEDGVYPSSSELRSWIGQDDSVQLTLSALVAPPTGNAAALLPTVQAHRAAFAAILREIKSDETRDRERAVIIRRLRAKHPESRIVVFSQFARTVETMFALLASDGRVAALTGSGAHVAGGRITRTEAIDRFAPVASNRPPPRQSEEITLLLTTDLLSEGVNLQDASVVIHLDLPWTPARMEQRLGRIARLGSMHETVHAYAIRPPACAEALVRTQRILKDKMQAAGMISSNFPSLMDCDGESTSSRADTATIEMIRAVLVRWVDGNIVESECVPMVSIVAAPTRGFLAAFRDGGRVRLAASCNDAVSEEPDIVLDCLRWCEGPSVAVDVNRHSRAISALRRYLMLENALVGIRPLEFRSDDVTPSLLKRISRIAQRARPHERADIASLAAQARDAITRPLGAEQERRLRAMDEHLVSDRDWLRQIIDRMSASPSAVKQAHDVPALIAIMIFEPDDKMNALSRATER